MDSFVSFDTEGVPIKAWIRGVVADDKALAQLRNVLALLAKVPGVTRAGRV